MSHIAITMLALSLKLGLGKIPLKMRVAYKIWALCNNDNVMKAFMKDKTSASNSCTVKFLNTYINHRPLINPEDFDTCPILLTQSKNDRWTPLRLSKPFLNRINNVDTKIVMLENGGHYSVKKLH